MAEVETAARQTHTLRVNGQTVTVDAHSDTPLLYVLRNDLDLKGSRFGCGDGLCGACSVRVDKVAQPSCNLPLWAVEGKEIETVEALLASDPPHPLIDAFVAEEAAQCGYCTAGILVHAKALLDKDPGPTREAIMAALDGNLCRCGAHQRIVRAVERAARQMAGEEV